MSSVQGDDALSCSDHAYYEDVASGARISFDLFDMTFAHDWGDLSFSFEFCDENILCGVESRDRFVRSATLQPFNEWTGLPPVQSVLELSDDGRYVIGISSIQIFEPQGGPIGRACEAQAEAVLEALEADASLDLSHPGAALCNFLTYDATGGLVQVRSYMRGVDCVIDLHTRRAVRFGPHVR